MNYKRQMFCSGIINFVISAFVICPLVVSFWIGAWTLADLLIFPLDLHQSALVSSLIGIVMPFFFTVYRDDLQRTIAGNGRKWVFLIISRIYYLIFAVASVLHWRGLWILLDFYMGFNYISALSSIFIGLLALIPLRCLRNVVSSPLSVASDGREDSFAFSTMFDFKESSNLSACICDALFGIIIVGYSTVFFWRGAFCLLDVAVFPENLDLSGGVCMILGFIMCLSAIILQQPVETLISKLKGKQRLLVLNLFHLLASFGSVTTWRGIWTIFPRYFFHEDPVHSNIIMASIGFGGLTLLNVSQSCINKGIYRDGDGDTAEPVELSYKYFKDLIFEGKESSKSPSTLDTPCTEVEYIYEVKQRLSVV